MQSKCPHCDKLIQPGQILCMNCGSYVVHMEEKKHRWPLLFIPVAIVAAVVAVLLYMQAKEEEIQARRQAALEAERPVDPAVRRQHEAEEAERRRIELHRAKVEDEKRRRLAARQAAEVWKSTPGAEKLAYVTRELADLRARISGLKVSAQSDSASELRLWLDKLEKKISAADTFIDAEQYDQARGLLLGARQELDDMLGSDGEAEAEEPPPVP